MTQITGKSVRRSTSATNPLSHNMRRISACVIAIALGYSLLMNIQSLLLSRSQSSQSSSHVAGGIIGDDGEQVQPHPPSGAAVTATSGRIIHQKNSRRKTEKVKRLEKKAKWQKHSHHNRKPPRRGVEELDEKGIKVTDKEIEEGLQGEEEPVVEEEEHYPNDGIKQERGDESYEEIRERYQGLLGDPNDIDRLHHLVQSIRKPTHKLLDKLKSHVPYNVDDCPEHPPPGYPIEWSIVDIIENWNPNDTTQEDDEDDVRRGIYQSICRFDHSTEMDKISNYRKAEVPFLIRDDPDVLRVVERWNQPDYLPSVLGKNTKYRTEYSTTNSLMYFNTGTAKKHTTRGQRQRGQRLNNRGRRDNGLPEGWEAPMKYIEMTYDEWVESASQDEKDMGPDMPHWYFRVNAKLANFKSGQGQREAGEHEEKSSPGNIMFEELPFFQPKENLYMVDPSDARGINCRFGMMGNTAAAHFDGSRNFVMLFGGERRYILSHPKNCPHLGLFPRKHPSGRHTAVNWSQPDLDEYPQFGNAQANEVVLQAGDVLYLPTFWFHHIISLDLNWQCNARSGATKHYMKDISKCGF